mmetsp:Transcript_10389/g.37580  ORF Transcript_10389/g.37580 Transcript_10389/m.37580 type:complete len:86 (-) Transcript_10389:1696-1953(-)
MGIFLSRESYLSKGPSWIPFIRLIGKHGHWQNGKTGMLLALGSFYSVAFGCHPGVTMHVVYSMRGVFLRNERVIAVLLDSYTNAE